MTTKKVGIVELTVPGEERIGVSGELKRAKYAGLQEEWRKTGWIVQILAIVIGCRGFHWNQWMKMKGGHN